MARSSTAASKPANTRQDPVRSTSSGALSREQKLEAAEQVQKEDGLSVEVVDLRTLLPQTSDIVLALRKLAAY